MRQHPRLLVQACWILLHVAAACLRPLPIPGVLLFARYLLALFARHDILPTILATILATILPLYLLLYEILHC